MLTYKRAALLSLGLFSFLSFRPANAQYGAPKVATVSAAVRPDVVKPGGSGVLLVTLNVGPQYHINVHKPNDPMYIPTNFQSQAVAGIKFGPVHYPAPKAVKVSYSSKPLLVYTGKTMIIIPFTVAKTAKLGKLTLAGAVSFQGCDAKSCYPPASTQVRAVVTIK